MIVYAIMLAISLALDGAVRPRRAAHLMGGRGLIVHILAMTALFGLFLAASGNFPVAGLLSVAMMALVVVTSNAKHGMLGEPLIFSDLALLGAVFRHPRFYLTAISVRQRWVLKIGGPVLALALALLFVPRLAPHLAGLALLLGGGGALALLRAAGAFRAIAQVPDVDADLARHGLIATLLLYWLRWRETRDPPACPPIEPGDAAPASPHIIVIVQCESFADPVELTGDIRYALPGLQRAQALAGQWGDLGVSGFGAYTMRTEYGVLFGRSEAALGFRRYDPFLTAQGETSYALSARLGGDYHCLFVHPHDMRFYGRDELMPAIGFDRLIGEEDFPPLPPSGGRYIDDGMVGQALADLIAQAAEPTLLYAVTMENHGPWDKDQLTGSLGGLEAYMRHLRSSDAMLSGLIDTLEKAGRTAMLVFFGDHRPSIPGVTEPGGARHTPYVMLDFAEDGRILTGANQRADLTPDALHHAILRGVQADRAVASLAGAALNPSGA